jgi:RNA polymerase sigma-70 factor (ECF subfamily)
MSPNVPSPSIAPVGATISRSDFVDLLARHDRQLRALAMRLLGDRELVEDALQEAYLRAFRALPQFRGESSVATWLHRIVHNVCMDELRRRSRRAESPFDETFLATAGTDADASDRGVERVDLAAGLADLPAEQRAAVILVDGYGMGNRAAGEILGVPAGTVGSRAFRARAALRQSLAVHAA